MGFFRPNFNENGPGVSKNGPQKKGFFLFWDIYFRKFWHLLRLNILFTIACCTVVLIGPSMAGMSYVLRNFSQEKHAFVWDDFLDAAKKNFKQSLLVGIVNTVLFILLGFAIYFYYLQYTHTQSFMFALPTVFCIAGFAFLLFMQYYMYLMLITFDIDTKKLYKNSLILAFYALPRNLLITLILFVSSLFVLTVPTAGQLAVTALGAVVIFLFYFSFVGLATVSLSYPVIKKVMIDPYKQNQTEHAPVLSENAEEPDVSVEIVFSDELTGEAPVNRDYIPPMDEQ